MSYAVFSRVYFRVTVGVSWHASYSVKNQFRTGDDEVQQPTIEQESGCATVERCVTISRQGIVHTINEEST